MFDRLKAFLTVLPILLYLITLVGVPLVFIAVISFLSRDDHGRILFAFTTVNYNRIFDPVILSIFRESLIVASLASTGTFLIGAPFAFFVASLKRRSQNVVILFALFVFWTSSLIRTNGWMIILQTNGILNRFLMLIGLSDGTTRYLFNLPATVFVTVYMFLPFMILPIYVAAESIAPTLRDAARDLGAGHIRTFLQVTLPLCKDGILAGFALVFIPVTGLFFISDTIGGGLRMTLGNLLHSQMAGHGNNHPFGAALAMILLIFSVIIVSFFLFLPRSRRKKQVDGR
ncbi:MAG: ABC transporter permease [Defluviitaleaceae bacterium]|nr:ABC transporter permease [Defluviitaleaceae bacterium]